MKSAGCVNAQPPLPRMVVSFVIVEEGVVTEPVRVRPLGKVAVLVVVVASSVSVVPTVFPLPKEMF